MCKKGRKGKIGDEKEKTWKREKEKKKEIEMKDEKRIYEGYGEEEGKEE